MVEGGVSVTYVPTSLDPRLIRIRIDSNRLFEYYTCINIRCFEKEMTRIWGNECIIEINKDKKLNILQNMYYWYKCIQI